MRVRWALEEVGQPYDVRPISFRQMKAVAHLAVQPFGQIPSWHEDDFTLFESGAIVLHIAQSHDGLFPEHPVGRARATAWMFAALNTVEPPIIELETSRLLEHDEAWYDARLAVLESRVHARLSQLANWLGEAQWLERDFSAADILMVTVLRRLQGTKLLQLHANLVAYISRAEARPAYQRAFSSQKTFFDQRARSLE